MFKISIFVASFLLVFFVAAGDVSACTCMDDPSPCSAFRGTPVVFSGLVESIDEEKVKILRFGKEEVIRTGLVAHFVVEERSKDINANEVDVVTGGGGGDCGYDFKTGERYLVYAYKSESGALNQSMSRTVLAPSRRPLPKGIVLSTTICSRTRPLAQARDDIDLVTALVGGKPETRIFGAVSRLVRPPGTYEYNIHYVGPMGGLTVRAAGANGVVETNTDKDGRYRFMRLAPGKYKVSVQLPEGYGPLFDFVGTEAEVELTSDACGIEHDFDAQVDGRISGRVFDADGKPVGDQVQVSVVTVESADKDFALAESRSDYTKHGQYEIEGLPPGRYVLGVTIADPPEKNSPYPTTYFPNGNELKQATIIDLKEGQKLTNYDLHLPPKLELVTISGVVVHVDGRPAAGADINIYDRGDPHYSLSFGIDIKTDSRGSFSIQAFKGRRYLLHAYVSKDYFAGTGIQSEMYDVDTSAGIPRIKLTLNKSGIFQTEKEK